MANLEDIAMHDSPEPGASSVDLAIQEMAYADGVRHGIRCGLKRAAKCLKARHRGQSAAHRQMLEALKAMVDEKVDYMTINSLGDPEKTFTVKKARAAIAAVENPQP